MTQLPMTGVGARIQRFRRLNDWSARQLAEESGAGLTRAVIANIESGRRQDLPLSQFVAICLALQVPPSALLVDLFHSPSDELSLPFPLSPIGDRIFEAPDDGTIGGALNWLHAHRAPSGSARLRSAGFWVSYMHAFETLQYSRNALAQLNSATPQPPWQDLDRNDRSAAISGHEQLHARAVAEMRELGVELEG